MFCAPSQILCNVLGVKIYYYGVIMALAITIGTLVSDWAGHKYFSLKKELFIDLAPYLIIFGIIGARIYYCVLDYDFYLRFPTEILATRHGGISIHGAMLGGAFGIWLFSIRHKIGMLKLFDVTSIGLSIGQAVGRWGNFFNSEAFGPPTNLPWKLYIAPQYRPIPFQNNEFFHPAFLYESILNVLVFTILLCVVKSGKFKKDGNLAILYLILYSAVRIFVELFRLDSVRYVFGISFAILVSVCIIIISSILLVLNNKRG